MTTQAVLSPKDEFQITKALLAFGSSELAKISALEYLQKADAQSYAIHLSLPASGTIAISYFGSSTRAELSIGIAAASSGIIDLANAERGLFEQCDKWTNYAVFGAARKDRETKAKFARLSQEWKADRHASSLARDLVSRPAYLRIIGMGRDALPLILQELAKAPDHWFVALKAIADEDPVRPESRGRMRDMTEAWLKWGREKGYVS